MGLLKDMKTAGLTAGELTEGLRNVARVSPITPGAGMQVTSIGGVGSVISKIPRHEKVTFEAVGIITGPATDAGKYTGKAFVRSSGHTGAGDLVQAMVGTLHSVDDAEFWHVTEIGTSYHLLPAGTPVTGFVWDFKPNGTPIILITTYPRGSYFSVKVEKDGGANGTASTVASYTYKVYNLDGVLLASTVALARPREKGTVTYQAGSSGYGTAFIDGTTLKLWDAGEVYGSAVC